MCDEGFAKKIPSPNSTPSLRPWIEKIKQRRLLWFGMWNGWKEGERLPIAALLRHVEEKKSRRVQRKISMDNVREDLKENNIDVTRIGEVTRNREVWRSLLRASSSAR